MTIGRVLGGALLAAAVTVTSGSANAENFFKLLFQGNGTFQPAGNGASLPSQYQRQSVRYNTSDKPGTIVIDTKNKFLYYVEGNGWATRYGVGVGREGFGWKGTVKIGRKAEWPTWTPPPEMRKRRPGLPVHMVGGPDNPLGARAMYLGSTLYRIHGTSEPWSIGKAVSSGCIRMRNEDVTDLYERVGVGTRVIVM